MFRHICRILQLIVSISNPKIILYGTSFDDFLRRGGNHEEREAVVIQILEQFREQANILLEADAFAGFDEVLFADAPVLGIVQKKVG